MKKFFRLVSMFALAGATLAYTGCTDYDEDIDKINDRIDALETGKLKTVEEQVASLQTTVTSLQAAQKTAEDALKSLGDKHDKDVKDLNAAIDGVKGDISSINESLKSYVTKTDADATYATKKSVEDALTRIGKLETALETLPTSEDVKKAQDAADAAQADATKALGDVKALKEALGVYAEAGKLSDALAAKLNISEFNTKFEEQLDAALENDGKITTAIANAISEATAEINTKIAILQADVEDLANRIQSLVFVPEYNDGAARATVYSVGDVVLSENVMVKGTFKVTPEKLAPAVAKYAQEGLVKVYAVATTATRAAAADVAASSVEVEIADDAAKTGRLEVSSVFPAKGIKAGDAIALYVNNPDSELTEGEKEDEKLDTKTYFSSAYVPVNVVNEKLTITLANATTEYKAQEIKKAWSEAAAPVEFMAGYEPRVKVADGKYSTLAEAEKEFALEGKLVGKVEDTFGAKDKDITYSSSNTAHTAPKASFKVTDAAWGKTVAMSTDDPIKAKAFVGDKVSVKTSLVYNASKTKSVALVDFTDTYEITRRVISITIDSYTQPWSYEIASTLSPNHATPYTVALDEDFDKEYKERAVVVEADELTNLDLEAIIGDGVPTSTEHKLGTAKADDIVLTVDAKASILASIAKVKVEGYEFAKKAQEYHLCNVYTNEEAETEIKVLFDLTLEAIPADVTVDLGEQTIDYVPNKTFHLFTEDATAKAAFAKVENYFKDYATFKKDFEDCAYEPDYKGSQKTNVKPVEKLSRWSHLDPMDFAGDEGHYHYIRLSQADVASYSDTYTFKTAYETWYGVKYTFTAKADLATPAYSLTYYNDWVDTAEDGSRFATLKGKKDADGKYVIDTDDLSKYFAIDKFDKDVAEYLKVTYTVLTEKDVENGYDNIPVLANETVTVEDNGTIKESVIDWANYTAQDLKVKATLTANGVVVNEKELTLVIKDPIVNFVAKDIETSRVPYQEKKVNLWSGMEVYGILTPGTDLINHNADATSVWNYSADKVYGLELTFDSYKVYVDDVDVTSQYVGKIVFSAADGTLTYKADSAEQVKDVVVVVNATLSHNFNYMGVEGKDEHNKPVEFTVTFTK